MATLEYHIGERGYPGYTATVAYIGGSGTPTYSNYRTVIPAHAMVDSTGAEIGTAANPLIVGGPTGASSNQVQGNVASGVADAGNPVKIGGVANNATPAGV